MKFKNLFLILLIGVIFVFLSFKSSSKVFAYDCGMECSGAPGLSVGKYCCDIPLLAKPLCINIPCVGGDGGETVGCFNCKEICSWGIRRDWCQTSSNCGSPQESACWIEGPYEADPTCCTGTPAGDNSPPVCQNVIPKTYPKNPDGSPAFSSLTLQNPGFEQGSANWTISNGDVENIADFCQGIKLPPHSGSSLQLHLYDTATYRIVGVKPNHVYRVSVWGMGSRCRYGCPDDCTTVETGPYLTAESGGVTKTKSVETPAWFTWGQDSVIIWANSNILTVTLQAKGDNYFGNEGGAAFDDLTIEELPTSTCSTQDCLLEVYATDNKGVTEMVFTNGPIESSGDWIPYSPVYYPWHLGSDGKVWAFFRDAHGNISQPCEGTCAINQPPNCTSMSPAHGTIIKQGETVLLTVQANDDGAVSKVKFYHTPSPPADYCTANWTKIGEDTNGADGWSTSWDTSPVPAGQVLVRADVYDDKGLWCTGNFKLGSTLWKTSSAGTWSAARTACQSAGGDLVTINDSAENSSAWNLCGGGDCWIGFSDQATEGTWVWAGGGGTGYTNWASGQPDNYMGNQNCALLWNHPAGTWDDQGCNSSYVGICESKGVNTGCDANKTCSDCHPVVTIEIEADPWFQTKDGDVHSGGDIRSKIPENASQRYFSLNGSGGYPGVVSYNGSSADFTPAGSVSAPPAEWLAKTSASKKSYNYFYQLLGLPTLETPPPEIKNEDLPSGDGIKAYSDNIQTGNTWQIGTRKIVILTSGKFLIKHRIIIDSGGSLVVVAQQGIGVSKNLIATGEPQNYLGGIFITDGIFYSSVEENFNLTSVPSEKVLVVQGGVIAGQVNLTRDLEDNSTTPAEKFRYDPSLFMNIHPDLWKSAFTWEELAP